MGAFGRWSSAYLVFTGILAHFFVMFYNVAETWRVYVTAPWESASSELNEILAHPENCTSAVKDQAFKWLGEGRIEVQLASGETRGISPDVRYVSQGTKGYTLENHHIYELSLRALLSKGEMRREAYLQNRLYFEVDQENKIVRCYSEAAADRRFECVIDRGLFLANGDCVVETKTPKDCVDRLGIVAESGRCLIKADQYWRQPVTKKYQVYRYENCEEPNWKRKLECDLGTERCYPKTQCESSLPASKES